MKKPTQRGKQKQVSLLYPHSKKRIPIFALIVLMAGTPFLLGKYFEFNTPGPYDSASNVYSAKHILDGAKIGVQEKPSAALATLLINMLGVWLFGFSEFGPKLLQAIFQAGALLIMFYAMRKLFGILPAAIAVILASVYLSAPLMAKCGNVKEQFMIAFMVIGISLFVLRRLGGKWQLIVLAGGLLSWAPLFKQTGISAAAAVGLFMVTTLFLEPKNFRQNAIDTLLLAAGAVAALTPLYIWIIAGNIDIPLPYSFIWKMFIAGGGTKAPDYISQSRQILPFAQQWPRVLRYYTLLILPITLATGAIIAKIVRRIISKKLGQQKHYERFVPLFAVWWLFDMAFVWISPRSYEQYYLPLNASAAMLSGYLFALYKDKLQNSIFKTKWIFIGLACFICMIAMSWHIFFGIRKSPHSGTDYGRKRRGYAQKLTEISQRKKHNIKDSWELVGEYINTHSRPNDKIYVWGWYPGIYITAKRLSSTPGAFTSEMHVKSPQQLSQMVEQLLSNFKKEMPKFIVDSRKRHFPWDRPPLELWPQIPKGFLQPDQRVIAQYDRAYSKMLHDKINPDEALRYQAMQPFRGFIMKHYKIVRMFGPHVLFQLKNNTKDREKADNTL